MYRTNISVLFLALVLGPCLGECEPPTNAELEEVVGLIILAGDSAAAPDVELIDSQIVCSAFGEQEGLLRQVSVVVEYTCTGHGNCLSSTVTEQIESQCNGGSWSNNVGGSTDDVRLKSPTATLTTPGRDDCAFCLSPLKAVSVNAPAPDDVTHCVACNSSCEGLGRCSGLDDSDCCNYYSNSLCVDVCPTPFTPNSDNNCDCPEGTFSFNNCTQLVDCGNLTAPDNGEVTLTGTVFNSVATYSCNSGYNLNGDVTRTCLGNDSWSGNEPTCVEAEVDCGKLPDPENGIVALSGTTSGSIANYTCTDGYELTSGNNARVCENDGKWSGVDPACTANGGKIMKWRTESYVSPSPSPSGEKKRTEMINYSITLIPVAVVSLLIIVTLIIVILIQCLLILRKDKAKQVPSSNETYAEASAHTADVPVTPNDAYSLGRENILWEEATYEAMV